MDDKTKAWIEKAKKVHGDRYDYSQVVYIKAHDKVDIICKKHNLFQQLAAGHISGKGCRKCQYSNACTSFDEFVKRANLIHGTRYEYIKVLIVKSRSYATIKCSVHGIFTQLIHSHLSGVGCAKCSYDVKRVKVDDFIAKAKQFHGDKYDYSEVVYTANNKNVRIKCPVHGWFEQMPIHHLKPTYGCSSCAKRNYSKGAIEWIEFIASCENTHLMHSLNGGERKIGKYHVDGYCAETNTCYEYHGCMWHGCIECYDPNDRNPINNKRYKRVYRKTIKRENYIRSKGYNLVVMWEHQWKDNVKWFLK